MGRRKNKTTKEYITRDIFVSLLKAGALLGMAVIAPNSLRMMKGLFQDESWDSYYPSSIERVANKLLRKGTVEMVETKDGTIVKISDKGKTQILKYDLANIQITKPKKWDGRWRIVIFDVPQKYNSQRNLLRDKLKVLGFYQFQESVWICPYPCEKEIKFIREVLSIPHEIKYIVAGKVENDMDLRRIFHI